MKKELLNPTLLKTVTVLLHIVCWLTIFGLYHLAFSNFIDGNHAYQRAFCMTLLLMTAFYVNTQLLINLLLEKGKYFFYAAGLITLIILSIIARLFLDDSFPIQPLTNIKHPYAIAFIPVLFCLIFSTLLQLLINYYSREKIHMAQINQHNQAQAQFLKNQINPHFLFNNLNNIYSLVVTNSPNAPQMILKLSDLLRYVLYKTNNDKVSIYEELEQILNLVDLYKLKENGTENIKINSENILTNGFIEPMILIPLVENCFKHWDISNNPNAFIDIELTSDNNQTGNYLHFKATNSTQKQADNISEKNGGIGLENIKKRLFIAYGSSAMLSYQKEQNIFKTELIIPCQKK